MSTSMLDITRSELAQLDVFNTTLPVDVERIIKAIPYHTVPYRMKAIIAITQLIAFTSQFRRNIVLWDDTVVPVNTLSFILTGSGAGKDSSVKAARKCFSTGYNLIEDYRNKLAVDDAISAARQAGEDQASEWEIYKSYYHRPPPIDIMPTSGPGLIQHINDLGDHKLGSCLLYAGEFGDELASNPDMMENIKVLSEVYDVGDKEMKYTKGVENRSKAIKGQAVSALLVGSPTYILYDESVKRKFQIAFMSKLARRSWFCYAPERIPELTYDSVDAMIEAEELMEREAKAARYDLQQTVENIARHNLSHHGKNLLVSQDVSRLFKIYKRYNSDLADSFPNQHSTDVLVRRHLQWKALKLAGAFAIYDMASTVEVSHYVAAMKFCELLSDDMRAFENDLSKAVHERFSDFIRTQVKDDGKAQLSVHDLKKHDFMSTPTKQKLQELANLAAAYDPDGIYSVDAEGRHIQYEAVVRTDVLGISFCPIDNTALYAAVDAGNPTAVKHAKEYIAKSIDSLEVADTTFPDILGLLQGDYAYSPFKHIDGRRGKDALIGGTKWLVLDVDNGVSTAEETHFMLMDINHYVALSSDPTNEFKYRIIIELDATVDLPTSAWRHFIEAIGRDIAVQVDPVAQSQIFYSYSRSPVYYSLDGEPLPIRDYVMYALDKSTSAGTGTATTKYTKAQCEAFLADPFGTFHYAYEAPQGKGSRSMMLAAYHARDLGATKAQIIDLMIDINNYWYDPMDSIRLEATILTQVYRFPIP